MHTEDESDFANINQYMAAFGAALTPVLAQHGFVAISGSSPQFRRSFSGGHENLFAHIPPAVDLPNIVPALSIGVSMTCIEEIFAMACGKSTTEQYDDTIGSWWIGIKSDDSASITKPSHFPAWADRFAFDLDTHWLPKFAQWQTLIGISATYNDMSGSINYANWPGDEIDPAARGIIAAHLLHDSQLEAIIAHHLKHVGAYDEFYGGRLQKTIEFVRSNPLDSNGLRDGAESKRPGT